MHDTNTTKPLSMLPSPTQHAAFTCKLVCIIAASVPDSVAVDDNAADEDDSAERLSSSSSALCEIASIDSSTGPTTLGYCGERNSVQHFLLFILFVTLVRSSRTPATIFLVLRGTLVLTNKIRTLGMLQLTGNSYNMRCVALPTVPLQMVNLS